MHFAMVSITGGCYQRALRCNAGCFSLHKFPHCCIVRHISYPSIRLVIIIIINDFKTCIHIFITSVALLSIVQIVLHGFDLNLYSSRLKNY